jgi:FkbM family methyltransferase
VRFFQNNKGRFDEICRRNRIELEYDLNKEALFLLQAIFVEREYADYFPFYEDAIILDVGAHFGYFSLFANINTGKDARIISVEPDPKNFTLLKKNIFENKTTKVELHNFAISDQSGEVKLFLGSSVNSSLLEIYALNEHHANHVSVNAMTLEQLFVTAKLKHIDFLKLDCEGAEFAIIMNSPPEIFEAITTISMEFHDLRDPNYTGNSMVKKLDQLGFRIVKFVHEKTNLGLNFGKIIATKLH